MVMGLSPAHENHKKALIACPNIVTNKAEGGFGLLVQAAKPSETQLLH